MADYSVTGAVAGVPLGIKPQVLDVVIDFSSTSLTTSDSFEVFKLKADTLVIMAGVEVLTLASTGSPVLDLGDDADDDLYAAAVQGHTTLAAGTTSAGKYYLAADTIDLIANTATFDGKVRVFAVIAEMGTGVYVLLTNLSGGRLAPLTLLLMYDISRNLCRENDRSFAYELHNKQCALLQSMGT
jgi:hypothetical protein